MKSFILVLLGNRCAWHSTKVVRDTLSYHPLLPSAPHTMKVMLRSFQHLYLSPSWWLSVSLIWRFLTENTCAPPGQKVRRLNKMSLSILLPKMSKKQYHPIFNLRQCLTGDPNSPPPPDSGAHCQLIYHFLECCPPEGGAGFMAWIRTTLFILR